MGESATVPRIRIGRWITIGFFALLLAHDVWEGIGNFLGIQLQGMTLGAPLSVLGWVCILAGVFVPILLFVLAVLFTRKMAYWPTVAIFTLAVMLSATLGVNLALGVNKVLFYSF